MVLRGQDLTYEPSCYEPARLARLLHPASSRSKMYKKYFLSNLIVFDKKI